MADKTWKVALVVLAAVATGVLIGNGGLLPRAQGISEGQSGGVIALVGGISPNLDAPIVVVSVPDQTVIVYNYNYNNRNIALRSARSYAYDKRLIDYQTEGPTVRDVRNFIARQGG